MLKILLIGDNKLNQSVVKVWCNITLNKEFTIKVKNLSDNLIPNQLINTGGNLSIYDKILQIQKLVNLTEYDYIISIDNHLNISDSEISSVLNISVKDINNELIFNEKENECIITTDILDDYPLFTKIINDLYNNYKSSNKLFIYDGCNINFGKLINKYYPNISIENWPKVLFKKDRETTLLNILNKISDRINLIKNNNNNNING